MASRLGWRLAQGIAAVVVLGFIVASIRSNWASLTAVPIRWAVRPAPLVLSALVVWSMYAMLIWAWREMLTAWGERLAPWPAARIWSVSSLGKYVPGKVWAIAGMAVMAQQVGVAAWAATGSAVLLQVMAIGTGAAFAATASTAALDLAHPGVGAGLLGLAALSAGGVALLFWPRFTRWLLARVPGARAAPAQGAPLARGIVVGLAANAVAWLGYGAALWLLARGLLPEAPLDYLMAVGAFAASYVVGLVLLLAPGGLLVREGVMIVLLQGALGLAPATALAIASRVLLTITEVGVAVPFLLFPRGPSRA